MRNKRIIGYGIVPAIVVLFLCNLFYGSVSIPAPAVLDILSGKEVEPAAWKMIVLQSRLPQAITALLAGSALAVGGLMLQTLFRNPLAGPSILGVSDGANFGVAVVMLWAGVSTGINLSTVVAALTGALAVLGLILYFSTKVGNNVLVLIIGMMIGYLASSGISILNSFATSESIHSYVLWGLGSFSNVSYPQIPFYSIAVITGLTGSVLLIKPLNILLLGENYATSLGIRVKRTRIFILLVTGFLTAIVTAFCGPVSFIGLAVPHIARMVLRTSNQQFLLPATLLSGGAIALLCHLLTTLPFGKTLLPLNAVTPLLGAPIILYVILNRKNLHYFQ
ncbi:MAG: iron ABC transporter permease [Dysgonamonadaceae bacterium]|jgi:iron complex transport system permease protein|nr:iron ABC transporter permease [Dysgonamonadaceae bacterium]